MGGGLEGSITLELVPTITPGLVSRRQLCSRGEVALIKGHVHMFSVFRASSLRPGSVVQQQCVLA